LARFKAIPHYPYLLLKMLGPNGVLSLRGDLKHAFDCDVQAIQIASKAQAANGREEIATIAVEMNLEELEILAKRPSILAPRRRPSVPISLKNKNSHSPTFSGTTKISLLGTRPT
jgi:hypothetical protein